MYRNLATIFSAVLWVLLPKCGLCLMAYAGIFSALGLGSLLKAGLLLPLMIALIALNVIAVVYMSVVKKQYTYAILSLAGAALFVVNKFYIGSIAVNIIAGLILLLAVLQVRFFQIKSKQCVFKKSQRK